MKTKFLCLFLLLSSSVSYGKEEVPEKRVGVEQYAKELAEMRETLNKAKCEYECKDKAEIKLCITECLDEIERQIKDKNYILSGKELKDGD